MKHKPIKSPITYYGGKSRRANKIAALLPQGGVVPDWFATKANALSLIERLAAAGE